MLSFDDRRRDNAPLLGGTVERARECSILRSGYFVRAVPRRFRAFTRSRTSRLTSTRIGRICARNSDGLCVSQNLRSSTSLRNVGSCVDFLVFSLAIGLPVVTIIDASQRRVHISCGDAPHEASAEGRQNDEQVTPGFGSTERIDASSSGFAMLAASAPHRARGDHLLNFIGPNRVMGDVLNIGFGPHDVGDAHGMLGTRLRRGLRMSTRRNGYTTAADDAASDASGARRTRSSLAAFASNRIWFTFLTETPLG